MIATCRQEPPNNHLLSSPFLSSPLLSSPLFSSLLFSSLLLSSLLFSLISPSLSQPGLQLPPLLLGSVCGVGAPDLVVHWWHFGHPLGKGWGALSWQECVFSLLSSFIVLSFPFTFFHFLFYSFLIFQACQQVLLGAMLAAKQQEGKKTVGLGGVVV